jgi:isoleucyl-tRNA synthetase
LGESFFFKKGLFGVEYKQTVLVGKTAFPMKAGLAQREPERLAKWINEGYYQALQERGKAAGLPKFVLHDGPPYANGHIHIGTAMNKVLKDMIVRSKSMDGYYAPYVPGWDCHGLPIELQALKTAGIDKNASDPLAIRQRCREFASRYIDIQREEFQRLGVWGDWENPYLTLRPEYEAKQVEIFGMMAEKGYIYKGHKPVYWCADCETALAEAEIEYYDHTSHSIYVRFRVTNDQGLLAAADQETYCIIWTTTPWTLPANLAICVHPDYDYAVVTVDDVQYLIAKDLTESVANALGWEDYSIVRTITGKELEGVETHHPFADRTSPLILGEHVTLDAGTGCVHTAPGHGLEDYEVGLRYGLDVFAPVDAQGKFTADAGKYAGLPVTAANRVILDDLKANGSLLKAADIEHQYPHCWRCKHPVMFRATPQWFASVEGFRREALEAIRQVQWIPRWGIDRITGMVKERHDWCVSRQRYWGVPIPIFYCRDCDEHLINQDTVGAVADLFRKEGSDAWWKYEAADILPAGTACPHCGSTDFRKETDIMDVWFDSGSSHAAVCSQHPELKWPADMYLEGSDQHRGWFQSSLLTSVAAYGRAPFDAVLTHGFVVDGEGRKMSKSLGNVIAPAEVINKYGADILRLWVASADYRGDVSISPAILEQMSEVYRRIRNTARFMLSNLGDFSLDERVPYDELPELDRWALLRAEQLRARVMQAYRDYEFHVLHQAVHNFCTVDMGGFYLDVIKDTLYCDAAASPRRKAAQTTLVELLLTLVELIAPVLPFTADEIWEYLPAEMRSEETVHYVRWRALDEKRLDKELDERWNRLLEVRRVVARALEQARARKLIGTGNEAMLHLYVDEADYALLTSLADFLPTLFIVSETHLHHLDDAKTVGLVEERDAEITVVVESAAGSKCERCWRYSEHVGEDATHKTLCPRCVEVVDRLG